MTSKFDEINRKICFKIRIERMKRKLSQEQLASATGLSKNSIGMFERTEIVPTLVSLAKIADAFGMTVSELTDISKVEL